MAASSLKNPAAIAGVGILLVAFGLFALWSHEPIFSTLTFAGAIGLGLALDDLRKKKHNRNKMKPKHIAALIAVAGILLVTGLVTVLQSAPVPTVVVLAGAEIAAVGARQFLTRRGGQRRKIGMARSRRLWQGRRNSIIRMKDSASEKV